jgi:predicted RNA binding protein YcfA (HicA-like mRNA interferase family)
VERDSKKIMKRLKKEGWTVARVSGSHHIMKHPDHAFLITVPHPKELKEGMAKAIAKQAGW